MESTEPASPVSIRPNDSEHAIVLEDGEVARLIRAYDWSATPLGPPAQWSASLRMVVRFMLANRFPHLLWWGPDHIQIYNDHYIPILGSKHPEQALGKPVRECWHEIYEVLAPLIDTPFNGGPATWSEDLELIVRRHGFPEESHFIVAYSPVPDDTAPRGIGGVLATVHETTEKVLAERRASILSELGARVIDTKTEGEACVQAVDILSWHPKDIPFALLYLVDEGRRELRLVSTTGVPAASIGPEVLGLDTPLAQSRWPLAKALATETVQVHVGLASLLPVVPMGPWPDRPDTAVVVPIKSNIAGRPAGALVLGISAYIRLDARYLSFVELAAARVGSMLELTRVRRDNEEQYRAYVQATSDVVYRMSADWTEMKHIAGRNFLPDQADPTRNWLQKYIVAADQPLLLAAIDAAIREKRVFELEHRVNRADGSSGWTSSRAIPLFDSAGEIVEWFGATTDITRRRETREALERQRYQLEEADRQKNEFLAMLAHELRNPLAPIRNAGELLTRTSLSDPQARSALATVERQVKHLTRLVDDLLDISRITQNRIELRRSPVRLDQVIMHALEAADPLIRQKQHRVALVQSRQPLTVNGDPERLVQCFGNVIANAAKYTPAAGEIDIESREEGGAAIVTIRDNGVGIPEELLPSVFDLFVQGERTLDRAQGGLGIGLTIVKRLIEMHGGTIGVTSKGSGRGASFEIRLPLVQIAESVTIVSKMQAQAPRRILLVDDNADGVYMLAELLRFDGHEVETALSGVEALERIPAFQPDVALVDIGLPGLDGYEVARRIREQPDNDHIQLIAITGYGRDEDRDRTHRAGFSAHLVKPVEFSALQRALT